MMRYDASQPVDPQAWLKLDEGTRMALAKDYHARQRMNVPNIDLHAALHAIVENQVAEGDRYPVKATLERLVAEGLNRHDAIHEIGRVLNEHMQKLLTGKAAKFSEEQYQADLAKLKAAN